MCVGSIFGWFIVSSCRRFLAAKWTWKLKPTKYLFSLPFMPYNSLHIMHHILMKKLWNLYSMSSTFEDKTNATFMLLIPLLLVFTFPCIPKLSANSVISLYNIIWNKLFCQLFPNSWHLLTKTSSQPRSSRGMILCRYYTHSYSMECHKTSIYFFRYVFEILLLCAFGSLYCKFMLIILTQNHRNTLCSCKSRNISYTYEWNNIFLCFDSWTISGNIYVFSFFDQMKFYHLDMYICWCFLILSCLLTKASCWWKCSQEMILCRYYTQRYSMEYHSCCTNIDAIISIPPVLILWKALQVSRIYINSVNKHSWFSITRAIVISTSKRSHLLGIPAIFHLIFHVWWSINTCAHKGRDHQTLFLIF